MALEITIAGQTLCFLLSIVLGIALGGGYDLFRILRVAFSHSSGAVLFEDLIFGIFATFATFLFLLTTDYGEIRFFLLAGEAIGFTLYYFTLGVLVLGAAKKIIAAVRWVGKLFYGIFISPICYLCGRIGALLKKIGIFFAIWMKKTAKMSNTHLQRCIRILYNQDRHLCRKDGEKKHEVNRT